MLDSQRSKLLHVCLSNPPTTLPVSNHEKVAAFKKLYLENCINDDEFPHPGIMKRIKLAEESTSPFHKYPIKTFELDFEILEHLELDASNVRDDDLYPLIRTIQVMSSSNIDKSSDFRISQRTV